MADDGWEVTVSRNGCDILTIGHNHLSGDPDIDEHAEIVRHAARHLLAFIGGSPDEARHTASIREGLDAAIRAAELALFVIRKQGVMPNSSWQSGFNRDLNAAKDARRALAEQEKGEAT